MRHSAKTLLALKSRLKRRHNHQRGRQFQRNHVETSVFTFSSQDQQNVVPLWIYFELYANMDNGNTLAAPQTVAEVEQLIQRLYKPGPASLVKHINDQLLQLQLSQDGWKLADELMASDDANVRFFAALTFTVKLNNDGSVFDPELSPW